MNEGTNRIRAKVSTSGFPVGARRHGPVRKWSQNCRHGRAANSTGRAFEHPSGGPQSLIFRQPRLKEAARLRDFPNFAEEVASLIRRAIRF